jgi:hypothetical protein
MGGLAVVQVLAEPAAELALADLAALQRVERVVAVLVGCGLHGRAELGE